MWGLVDVGHLPNLGRGVVVCLLGFACFFP
jgi:hypothetical protein